MKDYFPTFFRPLLYILLVFVCLFAWQYSPAKADLDIKIGYLEYKIPQPPILSNLEITHKDEGVAGARLGLKDNATTGKFLKHNYHLEERIVDAEAENSEASFLSSAKELLAITRFIAVNAPSEQLQKLAALNEAKGAILFNVASKDIELRDAACAKNMFHTIASRAMLADAISQFAVKKKWINWVMIYGNKPGDTAFAEALKNSAAKFRINLKGQKQWVFNADMRRNASAEVPLFTQDFPDYDLMIIADEIGDFGRYVMYNTWIARPVAGSEGVAAETWSPSVEQHGAAQLQSRFAEAFGRKMGSIDYGAWAAIRSIGEAVTRTSSLDADAIRAFMVSDAFELAGFKGRKLTYRNWNGQLRQPIPLSHPRAVVAQAPLEGFLHKTNELDTLGIDEPESNCTAFGEK